MSMFQHLLHNFLPDIFGELHKQSPQVQRCRGCDLFIQKKKNFPIADDWQCEHSF